LASWSFWPIFQWRTSSAWPIFGRPKQVRLACFAIPSESWRRFLWLGLKYETKLGLGESHGIYPITKGIGWW